MRHVHRPPWLIGYHIFLFVALLAGSLPAATSAAGLSFTTIEPRVIKAGSDYSTDAGGYGWTFDDDRTYDKAITAIDFVGGGKIENGMFVGVSITGGAT